MYKDISNAALNARQGEGHVAPYQEHSFGLHCIYFDILADDLRLVAYNRRLIFKKAGALPIVVALLAIILGSLGGEFIFNDFERTISNS